jgi:hypothetical protein
MARVTCPKCGYSAENMVLCPKCGTVISTESDQTDRTSSNPRPISQDSRSATAVRRNEPQSTQTQQYTTTGALGKFVAALGWIAIIIAVVLVFVAFDKGGPMGIFAAGPATGIAIGGLLLVVQGQLLQAVVNGTNHLAEIRDLLRAQRPS